MAKINEDFYPLLDDLVRPYALRVGDEADAARIVLLRGVVETLLLQGWQIGKSIILAHPSPKGSPCAMGIVAPRSGVLNEAKPARQMGGPVVVEGIIIAYRKRRKTLCTPIAESTALPNPKLHLDLVARHRPRVPRRREGHLCFDVSHSVELHQRILHL